MGELMSETNGSAEMQRASHAFVASNLGYTIDGVEVLSNVSLNFPSGDWLHLWVTTVRGSPAF